MTTTKSPIKTYTELCKIKDYKDRFEYLKIGGNVGKRTFGSDRVFNQQFYKSGIWLKVRDFVITRDLGRDLGHEDYEIPDGVGILIHHMNPIMLDDIVNSTLILLNPEYLITTILSTSFFAVSFGNEPITSAKPPDLIKGVASLATYITLIKHGLLL